MQYWTAVSLERIPGSKEYKTGDTIRDGSRLFYGGGRNSAHNSYSAVNLIFSQLDV